MEGMAMGKIGNKSEQKMRIEYVELGALRRWPGNPKDHDLELLGEAMQVNGYVTPVLVDEGTGLMVEGHGRLEKLERLKQAGAPPPERIEVRGGKWYVPVVRGIRFKDRAHAEKHLIAANRIAELGGWDAKALAAIVGSYKAEDLVGTGMSEEDVVRFISLAKGASSPTTFPEVTSQLSTDFCCPKCKYEWSGNPRAGEDAAPAAGSETRAAEEKTPAPPRKKRAARAAA
jgi:hypothetical protein